MNDHSWLQRKLQKLPGSDFEIQSEMTPQERRSVLRLLPGLPAQPGMSRSERELFMDAYLKHPDRLPWKPVFVSEEEITANGFELLRIQDKHFRALHQQIASGEISAVDQDHIRQTRAGMNIFIHRTDALRYLNLQRLHLVEDLVVSTPKKLSKPSKSQSNDKNGSYQVNLPKERQGALPETSIDHLLLKNNEEGNQALLIETIARKDQTEAISRGSPDLPVANKTSIRKVVEHPAGDSGMPAPVIILRRKQVEARTALSRSAIYDKLDPNSPRYDPSFPKQIQLGISSVGWVANEIDAWLISRTRTTRPL